MSQRVTRSTFLLVLLLATFSAWAAGPDLVGKWVIKKFDYKYANDPAKDYPLSRSDFETLVRTEKTFDFNTSGILTQSYLSFDKPEKFRYKQTESEVLISAASMEGGELINGISNTSWESNAIHYKAVRKGNALQLIQQNDTWKLTFYLEKVK